MEFTDIIHSPWEEIADFNADLFIAGCGYETRSICIPQSLSKISSKKIALCFNEHTKEISRPANDVFYKKNNYELYYCSGDSAPDYNKIFSPFRKNELKVMIDISVMTRTWYHSILKYINDLSGYDRIILKVVYCPALYSEPAKVKKKITMTKFSAMDEFRGNSRQKKSTALIMGLGNEQKVSQWVYDTLKPERTFLLYADPSLQQEYVENLFVNNHSLIEAISIKNLKAYPYNNTKEIYTLLIDIILPLREEYDVVIVPQGPKIFSLMAMIFQLSYPDICLYFPKIKRSQLRDRKPFDKTTSLELIFESE